MLIKLPPLRSLKNVSIGYNDGRFSYFIRGSQPKLKMLSCYAKMKLSEIGVFTNTFWVNIPNHFPHFHLDEFIVMPNHVHGIAMLENPYNT